MTRVDTTQDVVATAFLAHLTTALGLDETHCYETDEPDKVTIPRSGDYWATVYVGPGTFDVPFQVGGGANQCMETIPVTVTAYSRIRLDPSGRAQRQLHEVARGLYPLKRKLLKAMVGIDLTDEDDSTFLRQCIYALRSSLPEVNDKEGWGRISVEFGVAWDWDLS